MPWSTGNILQESNFHTSVFGCWGSSSWIHRICHKCYSLSILSILLNHTEDILHLRGNSWSSYHTSHKYNCWNRSGILPFHTRDNWNFILESNFFMSHIANRFQDQSILSNQQLSIGHTSYSGESSSFAHHIYYKKSLWGNQDNLQDHKESKFH